MKNWLHTHLPKVTTTTLGPLGIKRKIGRSQGPEETYKVLHIRYLLWTPNMNVVTNSNDPNMCSNAPSVR
jgi:hypothetical protein